MNRISLRSSTDSINPCRTVHWSSATPLPRRSAVLLGISAISSLATNANPAPASGTHRIGYLYGRSKPAPGVRDPFLEAFLFGLRELGYVEGGNLIIEWRFADSDYSRMPSQAESLVRANVEVIVTTNLPSTLAAQRATKAIPIVFASMVDPVGAGVVSSLSQPDNNTTGRSLMSNETAPKQFELLRLMLPNLRSIAVLVNPGVSIHQKFAHSLASTASQFNAQIEAFYAKDMIDLDQSLSQMRDRKVEALVVPADAFFNGQRDHIAERALTYRLPTMFPYAHDVEGGGLLSYGPDLLEYYKKAATSVDRILKGARPRDLPIEQPLTFSLGINLRTAKGLGIVVPKELRLIADQLVD